MERNAMGGAFSTYWRRDEAYTWFWWRKLRESDLYGDLGVDVRIILRWNFRKWDVE
jgi:hypothetical protein